MTSNQIRQSFLDFFANKQHTIVPSAPMVVKNDPTLMFTNAGMNQFKDIFLGNNPAPYKRAADSQKCLRVSGKHNDLEEVGIDTYHHTLFEMLGNWSFGDYFKKEAILWAWEYLTEVLKIDKSRLYATVCEACPDDNIALDQEAYDIWKTLVPENHIIIGSKKDNFWEMGETGPCGPCSEIHYDSRPESERQQTPGHLLVNKDNPQVIEIWNLVFMQFNRKANGSLEPLPQKHVDTGMGFERLCRIIQGKNSNYDIDLFQDIIAKISELSGIAYGKAEQTDIAIRVVSDHIRAISFSIADGQLPSNNKAGYVIRRLLRRAVRYAYTFLKQNEPFLCQLVPTLVEVMGNAYPELQAQKTLIEKVIREEELSFLRTLSTGMQLLENITTEAKAQKLSSISGKAVFEMYDTFGFPLDLTELILRENNLSYDKHEYEQCMQEQKSRSRLDAAVSTGDWIELLPNSESQFVGYDQTSCPAKILRYRQVESKGKKQYQLVLDKTPFYAESGGQVGDSGTLSTPNETIEILTTKKENNLNIHICEQLPEKLAATFNADVNIQRRRATECNHSATHLMHFALRQVLGTHVEQKGSLVSPDCLRFDFSHFQKVSPEEIRKVERLVNQLIRQNTARDERRDLPIDEARQMGAMALFGEKYGDKVRVIRFGDSTELCGGTHVAATGNIGFFKIISESAVAAGIRRIEAVTGESFENHLYQVHDSLQEVKDLFNNSPSFLQALRKSISENAELKKQVVSLMQQRLLDFQHHIVQTIECVNGLNILQFTAPFPADMIKDLAFRLRSQYERLLFIAASDYENKPTLTIALSDDLANEGLNAATIVKTAAKEIQGGGGGQAFFATAGGKKLDGITQALELARKTALEALK